MKTLDQWLDSLNVNKIDLGLDRVKKVLTRHPFNKISSQIITVGGTNGKGSTVTAVGAILRAHNKSVGLFTSPHIFKYNERIRINGSVASDNEILAAFEAIDEIRKTIELSYFEFSLLAALWIFHHQNVDYMVLEVGLGGRLDAVNALQSKLSIITTVDIDHSHWLGDNIEAIATEKAAIMRPKEIMVYGDESCPQAIENRALKEHVTLLKWQHDFNVIIRGVNFDYHHKAHQFLQLPKPKMAGDFQIRNFSTGLTACLQLEPKLSQSAIKEALEQWQIPGRIQCIKASPQVIVDVAHNRQSVSVLNDWIAQNPVKGHTRAVFSVLKDKQDEAWLAMINPSIDHWFIFELLGERALDIQTLKIHLADAGGTLSVCQNGTTAFQQAIQASTRDDRVLVFGSFHVLDEVFRSDNNLLLD